MESKSDVPRTKIFLKCQIVKLFTPQKLPFKENYRGFFGRRMSTPKYEDDPRFSLSSLNISKCHTMTIYPYIHEMHDLPIS